MSWRSYHYRVWALMCMCLLPLTVLSLSAVPHTLVNIGVRILHNNPFDFKGNFVFIDTYSKADEQKNPNYLQLDTRFKLYFLTAEEDLKIGNN